MPDIKSLQQTTLDVPSTPLLLVSLQLLLYMHQSILNPHEVVQLQFGHLIQRVLKLNLNRTYIHTVELSRGPPRGADVIPHRSLPPTPPPRAVPDSNRRTVSVTHAGPSVV